jgi:hypothetical protein
VCVGWKRCLGGRDRVDARIKAREDGPYCYRADGDIYNVDGHFAAPGATSTNRHPLAVDRCIVSSLHMSVPMMTADS